MQARYKHTNIVAHDWQKLAQFYEDVFGCVRRLPERHLSGTWLDKGTGMEKAHLSGIHLALPGYDANGPTLEIFQYAENEARATIAANREGITHLAFEVDNVEPAVIKVLEQGGSMVGEIVSSEVEGVGLLTFVYMADPEGNIIELQSWE